MSPEGAVDARLALAAQLAWVVAAACAAAALPWPSVRLGALALAATTALLAFPGHALARLLVAAAAAVSLFEGVWRGSLISGAVAIAATVLLVGASRHHLGLLDRTAIAASLIGAVLVAVVPGLDLPDRLAGVVAWLGCGAGLMAGPRLSVSVARSKGMAAPFALIAFASGYLGFSYAWARSGAGAVPSLQLAAQARNLGIRGLERQDLLRAADDPQVPPDRQVDALQQAYRLGAGRAAWVERVSRLREMRDSRAEAETHRLLLLESAEEFPSRKPDASEQSLNPHGDFAGRLLMQAGRYEEAADLFKRWSANGGGNRAMLLRARAQILDGRLGEARELLATLPSREPDVACTLVDAGDSNHDVASLCSTTHPFHQAALEILRDRERLAAVPGTDPVADEFGGALKLIGRRATPRPGGMTVALVFEGMMQSLDPGRVELEIHGPGAVSIQPSGVDVAPSAGDLVWAVFDVQAASPGAYTVDAWVRSPWGPWLRTRRGQIATDWPYPVGPVAVP
jgi:tetratricopeptide (TPR) repeat protein